MGTDQPTTFAKTVSSAKTSPLDSDCFLTKERQEQTFKAWKYIEVHVSAGGEDQSPYKDVIRHDSDGRLGNESHVNKYRHAGTLLRT